MKSNMEQINKRTNKRMDKIQLVKEFLVLLEVSCSPKVSFGTN